MRLIKKSVSLILVTSLLISSILLPGNDKYQFVIKANAETMAGDTISPTSPGNLNLNSYTNSSISLSWDASSDNTGVADYEIYRDGSKVGTTANTKFTDTGLVVGTTYLYSVKAVDAAGNESDASNGLSVKLSAAADTEAPTAPTNLQLQSKTETTATISWSASSDNVGINGYNIYRDGTKVGTTTGTSCTDTGLTSGNTYNYAVKAIDFFNNESNASNSISVTLDSAADTNIAVAASTDTTPPTAPTNLQLEIKSETTAVIKWDASTDNTGVAGYDIYRDGTKIGSSATTTYADTGLTAGTSYTYTVKAKDEAGNVSVASEELSVTAESSDNGSNTADTAAPSVPVNLTCSSKTGTSANLSWDASTDNTGVAGYDIYRDGTKIGSSATTTYADAGLTAGTSYTYTVKAKDEAGNVSAANEELSVTAESSDNGSNTANTAAPSLPVNLTCSSKTGASANLSWDASTDNTGVAGYDIYRDGTKIGSSATTTYADTGLTAGTTYTYSVKAKDTAGNVSDASNSLTVTTLPGLPASISATATATSVTLCWNAVSGAASYEVQMDGTVIAKISGTSYTAQNLSPNTNHSFSIKAVGDGGESDWGLPTNIYTLLTAPTNLSVTFNGATANVTWSAVDGATEYAVYKNNIQIGTSTTLNYSDTSSTSNTPYSYSIKALNDQGNTSDFSNKASGIVPTYINTSITLSQDVTYGDVYINSGTIDLNGHKLTVNGNLIQSGGTMYIDGGQLIVGGDYRIASISTSTDGTTLYRSCNGLLKMVNPSDYVLVNGLFETISNYSSSEYLTAGTLELKGDFYQYGGNQRNNFAPTGTHKVILSGAEQQTVDFFDVDCSHFNILEIVIQNGSMYNFPSCSFYNDIQIINDTGYPLETVPTSPYSATPISSDSTVQYVAVWYLNESKGAFGAGHAAILLEKSDGSTEYYSFAGNVDNLDNKLKVGFGISIPGCLNTSTIISNPEAWNGNIDGTTYDRYIRIPISDLQGKEMHNKMNDPDTGLIYHIPDYNLYANNCNNVAQQILASANLNFAPTSGQAQDEQATLEVIAVESSLASGLITTTITFKIICDYMDCTMPNGAYTKGTEIATSMGWTYGEFKAQ